MNYTVVNGKKLSQMTLGTVQLGMNYGIANTLGQPDEAKSHAMLSCALDNGITSLDTARLYGTSEEVLGGFFKKENPDNLFITSKFRLIDPFSPTEKEIEKEIYTSVETSLETLGVKKLDCLLLHRGPGTLLSQYQEIYPKTMERLVKEGYTSMVGVSIYLPEEVDTLLEHDVYQATQIPMSLFDQKLINGGYVRKLQEKNITTFVRSVFFQGLFFLDPVTMTDPILVTYVKPYLEKLHELCQKTNMSIAEFAISFIRDVPGVTSLVLGADTPEQVKQNISYMQAPKLPDSIRKEAEEAFRDVNVPKIMEVLSRPKK